MFDKIETKVKEIRKEPEHIRVRYVWGAVIISMSVVVFIWLISMRVNFLQINQDVKTRESLNEFHGHIDDFAAEAVKKEESVSIDALLQEPTTNDSQTPQDF